MKTLRAAFVLGASLRLALRQRACTRAADASATAASAAAAAVTPMPVTASKQPEPVQHARARGRSLLAGDLRTCLGLKPHARVIRCEEGRR